MRSIMEIDRDVVLIEFELMGLLNEVIDIANDKDEESWEARLDDVDTRIADCRERIAVLGIEKEEALKCIDTIS